MSGGRMSRGGRRRKSGVDQGLGHMGEEVADEGKRGGGEFRAVDAMHRESLTKSGCAW